MLGFIHSVVTTIEFMNISDYNSRGYHERERLLVPILEISSADSVVQAVREVRASIESVAAN